VSIKKGLGPRDHRSEPDEGSTSEKFRVDRVFVPTPAARRDTGSTPPLTRRPSGQTQPPVPGTVPGMDDAELALRRQLSRLQRQLADAQRELANKDDELAVSVEKRVEVQTAYDAAIGKLEAAQQMFEEINADRERLSGVEQRLQDSIATADELNHQLERERAERGAMAVQFDEANAAFERARALWKDETAVQQEHHAAELAKVEVEKRRAIDAAEAAMKLVMERQDKAHADKAADLEAAHKRALATLRGELEPKVAEARNLAASIERLNSEIAALRSEQLRELAERNDLHKWETQQASEAHTTELAALARKHEADVAKANEELAAKVQALATAERNQELREQLWEQTTNGLRESQKKIQQELAEAKEKLAQEGASKWAVEQRLVGVLQQLEQVTNAQRDLEKRLEIAEGEARHNALDRQRFAAYLEEGLAMVGALPPKDITAPVSVPAPASEDSGAVVVPPPSPETKPS
jgi:chromosome segregation ATPase